MAKTGGVVGKNIKYGKNFQSTLSIDKTLNTTEKAIAKEAYELLNSSEFEKISSAYFSKSSIQIEINGRPITFDDAPFSGFTNFGDNGFHFGREVFISEEELIKTVLHELYR